MVNQFYYKQVGIINCYYKFTINTCLQQFTKINNISLRIKYKMIEKIKNKNI